MHESAAVSKEARDFTTGNGPTLRNGCCTWRAIVNDPEFYPSLRAQLEEMRVAGASANHLFYVSTPSSVAGSIIEALGTAGLNHNANGWSRIVLEKPFGRDLSTARELNSTVLRTFAERDVYRIDHYLGKETVQNMLVFRFANSLFEPVWNRNYIDYVEITAAETVGVENRAAFYEETGALRDMVAEPSPATARLHCHGAADRVYAYAYASRRGRYLAPPPNDPGRNGRAARFADSTAEANRWPSGSGLPAGAGRQPEFIHRNLRCHRISCG